MPEEARHAPRRSEDSLRTVARKLSSAVLDLFTGDTGDQEGETEELRRLRSNQRADFVPLIRRPDLPPNHSGGGYKSA